MGTGKRQSERGPRATLGKGDKRARAASRPRYHHGNLRPALVEAALRILETGGVSALTLRGAARRAGVSQAAPYRHFSDKEDLLAAVAEEGFRALSAAMRQAAVAGGADFTSRFRAVGLAYVRFAVEQPARFRLMFGREVARRETHVPLRDAADETFRMLVAGVEEGQRRGVIHEGDPRELSIAAWSIVHGLSALLVDGQLSRGAQDLEGFVAGVTRHLFLGLRQNPLPT